MGLLGLGLLLVINVVSIAKSFNRGLFCAASCCQCDDYNSVHKISERSSEWMVRVTANQNPSYSSRWLDDVVILQTDCREWLVASDDRSCLSVRPAISILSHARTCTTRCVCHFCVWIDRLSWDLNCAWMTIWLPAL